ncbi:MAG: DUF429 domain-containing protein [Bdellovibrionales bacterium]|nr:DUF429 domain-containing protein [Bdellovibrionales bacterium]
MKHPPLKSIKFIGLSLGGGKTTKSCLTVIEYFPLENKVFLRHLFENISRSQEMTSDEWLMETIKEVSKSSHSLYVNVPVQLPVCLRCRLKCPGVERCRQKEVQWLRDQYSEINKKLKPKRVLTPYTERCVDYFVTHLLEEKFDPGHGLGSNLAPLTARWQFLQKQTSLPVIEVFTKAALWRIGRSLGVSKNLLRFHKHAIDGREARSKILDSLIKRDTAFLYVQDIRLMIDNSHAFDAFVCGMTGLLNYKKQCEPRPKNYPKLAQWMALPKENIEW